MAEPLRHPPTPRWVKLPGIAVGVLVLLAVVVTLVAGGPHGSGRHIPAEDASGGQKPEGDLQ
jgi:hypothetical protein